MLLSCAAAVGARLDAHGRDFLRCAALGWALQATLADGRASSYWLSAGLDWFSQRARRAESAHGR
jgi:hypothetical protein